MSVHVYKFRLCNFHSRRVHQHELLSMCVIEDHVMPLNNCISILTGYKPVFLLLISSNYKLKIFCISTEQYDYPVY